MKRNLLFWSVVGSCLGSYLLLMTPPLRAASLAGANLVVSIRPEATLEVGPALGWGPGGNNDQNNNGDSESLVIPVRVRVRLNRATDCALSLSLVDSQGRSTHLSTISAGSDLTPLLDSAVAVRRYSHSGTFSESIVVTGSPAAQAGPEPMQFVWTLVSSDGAISWTTTSWIPTPTATQAP